MKKFLLFFVPLFIGIVLFGWIIKIVGVEGLGLALYLFFSWQGLVLLFLTCLIVLVGTLRWREILRKQGFRAPFSDFFQAYLVGFAIDYLLPVIVLGGEAARARILREKHSLSWEKGVASGFIDRILELTSVLLLIFPGIIFFLLGVGLPSKNIAAIIFSFLFFVGGGLAFFYFKNSKRESILKIFKINHHTTLEMEKEIFDFFRSKKVFKPLYLSFLKGGLLFLRVWVLMFFLGEKMDILSAWPTFSFAWIGTRLPIPADIGSHEVLQVFLFNALGLGADKGTAFASIVRGVETILSLIGLIFLFKFGLQFLDRIFLRKIFKEDEEPRDSKDFL